MEHEAVTDHQAADNALVRKFATVLGDRDIDSLQQAENGPGQLEASPGAAADQISGSTISPDVATILSEIMDHTERQEETVALGPQEIPSSGDFPGARGYAFLKANSHLKIQSLPILDNLVSSTRP